MVVRKLVIDENFGILEVVRNVVRMVRYFPNTTYMQRILTRISLKLIINFVIEVSTGYLRDGFIYIKLGESKAVLLN